jgi:periplasmic copper chaperone A
VSRTTLRLLTVAAAATAAVGLTALPALAHVSVSSPGATQGGYGVVTFRVPTESATASTTGLKVQLPADTPLASVSVKPLTGWTYTVTRAKLAQPVKDDDGNEVTDYPSVVEWKAAAGNPGVKPGEFQEFQLSVGPMPDKDSISFKAIQAYSDGKTVDWIEEPAAGSSDEPEFPAPTLTLAKAGDGGTTAATADTAAVAAPAADDDGASKGSVTGAYVVGGIGLVAGLAALGLALTRRRTA